MSKKLDKRTLKWCAKQLEKESIFLHKAAYNMLQNKNTSSTIFCSANEASARGFMLSNIAKHIRRGKSLK